MRIAVLQSRSEAGAVTANLLGLEAHAAQAADAGAGLLICPEMFLSGYNIGAEAAARLAEWADGPSLARVGVIARDNGIALLIGYPERGADGAIYNAARLIGREGRGLANYRKCHLFGALDRAMFRAGESPPAVVDLEGVRIGLLICYDVEFPEAVRMLALAGAELVAVPTALMAPYDVVARTLVPARAIENQVFIAYANRIGREGDRPYVGQSCIVGPDGADLARAGPDEEALLLADLDVGAIARARSAQSYLRDRRPDLYAR